MMRIEFKHHANRDFYPNGTPYYFNSVNGNVIETSTPPNGFEPAWVDFTGDVENLEDLVFNWKFENENKIEVELDTEVILTGGAFTYVLDWLFNKPFSAMNMIDVRFFDDNRIVNGEFVIRPQKINRCENDNCSLSLKIDTFDYQLDCLKTTAIDDNWNGFLNREFTAWGVNIEKKPKYVVNILFALFIPFWGIGTLASFIFTTVNGIYLAVQRSPVGRSIGLPDINISFNPSDVSALFKKLLGVGYHYSAAKVIDYVRNGCDRCKIEVARKFLFNSDTLPDGSSNIYKDLNVLYTNGLGGYNEDDTDKRKLKEFNNPLLTVDEFLDKLTKVFNSRWYVKNGSIYFWPKWDRVNSRIIDLRLYASDIVSNCISYSSQSRFASRRLEYRADGSDFCSVEAMPRYNGTVDFDVANKRHSSGLFKGRDSISNEFGATRFMNDGISDNYIKDSIEDPISYVVVACFMVMIVMQIIGAVDLSPEAAAIAIGVALIVALGSTAISVVIYSGLYTEQVLFSNENVSTGRLILPNPGGQVDDMVAINYSQDNLQPNTFYNTTSLKYDDIYKLDNPRDNRNLPNYPMFFEPNFSGNLYDNFWQKSDERFRKINRSEFTTTLHGCYDLKKYLGLYKGSIIAVDDSIKVPYNNIVNDLVISEISCNFVQNIITITSTGV